MQADTWENKFMKHSQSVYKLLSEIHQVLSIYELFQLQF